MLIARFARCWSPSDGSAGCHRRRYLHGDSFPERGRAGRERIHAEGDRGAAPPLRSAAEPSRYRAVASCGTG